MADSQSSSLRSEGAMRSKLAVGLIAGEGVDLSGLGGLLGGSQAPPGFSLLTRDAVVSTDIGENATALQLKERWEAAKTENPDTPMPHNFFACLLAAVLKTRVYPPAELPDDDNPSSALLRFPGGPNSVCISLDLPQSIEQAREFQVGGALDAVFIVRQPPRASPSSTAERDLGSTAESRASVDSAKAPQAKTAETLYADLQRLGKVQAPLGHNPTADTFFGSVSAADTPEQLLQSVSLALMKLVHYRREYAAWLQGATVVQLAPQETDLRHYDETLSQVPHACLSYADVR